jgi:two-component system, NarL family, sensor histidine kinase DesK
VADLMITSRPWWVEVVGYLLVGGLLLTYLAVMHRWSTGRGSRLRWFGWLAAVVLLIAVVGFGVHWGGLIIYAAMLTAMTQSGRLALAGPLLVGAAGFGLLRILGDGWTDALTMAFIAAMSGAVTFSSSRVIALARELSAVKAEAARLAVADERVRFARDMHDLLGHSLSLIVLKSELAGRLMDAGRVEPARAEVRDIEEVTRRSLEEVREAVSGYRQALLGEELDNARDALAGAGIRTTVPTEVPTLEPEVDRLFGWAVREGTTNVLRHSQARSCEIRLVDDGDTLVLEVLDDGPGERRHERLEPSTVDCPGNGLAGLVERAERAGGLSSAGPRLGGGFRLAVAVPGALCVQGPAVTTQAPSP